MLSRIGDWQRRGRFWHNLKTGRVIPVIAGGALPATDSFTTGSDQAIATYSANWTVNQGQINVLAASDDFKADVPTTYISGAHWNADTFADNQYAQIVISYLSDYQVGAGVRMHASTDNFYGYMVSGTLTFNDRLFKTVSGTTTNLATKASPNATTSDTIRLEANSTTLTPKINGSTTNAPSATTDSAFSSGYAGIVTNNSGAASAWCRGDNFEGGNLGGTAYTLVCAGGTYTLTGNAATLKVTRKLTAETGSYALTGQAAAIKVGYKITCGTGSYTYAGQDATIKAGRKVTADWGTYTYTGIDASLKTGRKFVLDYGQYTYTGNAATINKGIKIAADAGSYTLSGSDATLKLTRRIPLDYGQYTYTGNDATLTYTPTGATYQQEGYRWRNDDGDEDGATWRADQDTTTSIPVNTNIRLRVLVNTTGDTPASAYRLEYREVGAEEWSVVS